MAYFSPESHMVVWGHIFPLYIALSECPCEPKLANSTRVCYLPIYSYTPCHFKPILPPKTPISRRVPYTLLSHNREGDTVWMDGR